MTALAPYHLAAARKTPAQLRKDAYAELDRRLATQLEVLQVDNDCFALRLDGTLESSAMLSARLWSRDLLPQLNGGQLVAAIPSRDVVICGSAAYDYSIRHMRTVVNRLWMSPESDHLLSQKSVPLAASQTDLESLFQRVNERLKA